MVRCSVLAVIVLAGCPAGGDDVGADGGVDATQLIVTWTASPALPGPVGARVEVHELRIAYSSLRVLGDAAPGDRRTSRDFTDAEWESDRTPRPIDFPSAPPGLYASVELGVGGGPEELAIHGTVDLGGGAPIPFEIEDEASNPVVLDLAVDLRPGASATVPLVVDLGPVLAAVPFEQLPVVAGHISLHRDDPRMGPVRAAMAAAVTVAAAP